jgi:hypothetical protein
VQLPIYQAALETLEAGKDRVEDGHVLRAADRDVWNEFESSRSKERFERMGLIFVDLARIPEAANSRAFVDPFHPGEYLVLASVIAALKDQRVRQLLPRIDVDALERTRQEAEAAGNYLNVFGSRF